MNNYSIYRHIFPNGKSYIGKCYSKPHYRWGSSGNAYLHKYEDGSFMQPKIAHAIIKFGWENIQHEILYTGLTPEEACEKEIEMIEKYDSFNNGYNATKGGEGSLGIKGTKYWLGRKHTEESKRKIGETQVGEKNHMYGRRGENNPLFGTHHSGETKKKISEMTLGKHGRSVIQLSKDGEFIKEWGCISDVQRELGILVTNISRVCRGKKPSAGGYKWEYKEVA